MFCSISTIFVVFSFLIAAFPAWAVSVTTYHNDIGRTGANPNETILNTTNVAVGSFGRLYNLPVDGQIYAQPLYLPNVTIPGNGVHNVLYVATMNDWLYAFDADSSSTQPLWQINFGLPVPSSLDIQPQIGILSTPVIDATRGTIYVVSNTYVAPNAVFSLHAIDITTGAEKAGSPAIISGSVAGTGAGSTGGTLVFNPNYSLQRPALLEVNGKIYIGFGSHADQAPYHGWIFSYDGVSLRRLQVQCLSPNGYGAAIWQSGAGMASDGAGNIYFGTGNGDFNLAIGDYGDSVVKMNANAGLAITSYFTPSNQLTFEDNDQDLGAAGVIVLPGSVTLTAPMIVAGSKDDHLYLLNSANLGAYNTTDSVVQELSLGYTHFGSGVYYNNILYKWGGEGDVLRMFSFSGTGFSPTFSGTYSPSAYYKNEPSMSLSANGLTPGTAILWASHSLGGTDWGEYPGMLHAYDGVTGNELWNSGEVTNDSPGAWSKWGVPTIANGKVYLPTFDSGVAVYGLLPPSSN